MRLEAALAGSVLTETAQDWLALNGPCESPAETAFVTDVVAPTLGSRGLRALRGQEPFVLPGGGIGRIDFVLTLNGVRLAIEIDGAFHDETGPGSRRPEQERMRQNAIMAAGYRLLRFTAREVLYEPRQVAERLRHDLVSLGLMLDDEVVADVERMPIAPFTHAMLGQWPRNFVRAQQSTLDLMNAVPHWLAAEERTLLVPRTERGATVLGALDAIDACHSAHWLLSGESPSLQRVVIWVGDDVDMVRELVQARNGNQEVTPLPYAVIILDGEVPEAADALLISLDTEDLDVRYLSDLAMRLRPEGKVAWTFDVDAPSSSSPPGRPQFFAQPNRSVVERLLERFFGFPTFREGQWEIVEPLLKGESTLGVLPTGAGKTVCFQLPALLQPGLAIVVSPLKSLMDDQVMNLRSVGFEFSGRVHSSVPEEEAEEEFRRFGAGLLKLFYVSPERFHSEKFVGRLVSLSQGLGVPISYFVVDEAHLASEWGHDFRPSYLTLPDARERLCPEAPIALLTATAPRQIREDLAAIFHRSCSLNMVLPPTFDRPELSFEVRRVNNDQERLKSVLDLVRRDLPQSLGYVDFDDIHDVSPTTEQVRHGGLVFAPWGRPGDGRQAIRVAGLVEVFKKKGVSADEYRSSTSDQELERAAQNRHTQERFKRNELPLVVATKGFGTGIDKPDIRYVVHADMPASLEALYQEAGRAGRDRKDARAAMIWRPRHENCHPQSGPPVCVESLDCPLGLPEKCSFGVQAWFRHSSQPGAIAEVETSATLWRSWFVSRLSMDVVRVPRSLKVGPITREEVVKKIDDIVKRLSTLGVCGALQFALSGDELSVENRVFSLDDVARQVRTLRPDSRPPKGETEELFLCDALQIAFELSKDDANHHVAVWVMYLRGSQHKNGKTRIPRGSKFPKTVQPDVERFLTRLMALGVARHYRYDGVKHWAITLAPASERSVSDMAVRLQEAILRHGGALPTVDPLPEKWSDAVEVAMTRLIQSWYETIAARSWETLESLEEFAAATDCRRRRIAQYMNESAVSIPQPCGHCDNCGIKPLGDLRVVPVEEQIQARVEEFNQAFDAMANSPGQLGSVAQLMALAEQYSMISAVRDRAARHLERAPLDLSPRFAAALAAHGLGESGTAERHVRTILKTLGDRGDVERLQEIAECAPPNLLATVVGEIDDLLSGIPEVRRDLIAYLFEVKADRRRAVTRAVDLIRRAASPFRNDVWPALGSRDAQET